MRKTATTLMVFSALLGAMVSTGCGGGSSTAAEAPVTKAVLIKRGDAICRHTDVVQRNRMASYETLNGGRPVTTVNADQLSAITLPPIAAEIGEIAALDASKADEIQMRTIINGWKAALTKFEEEPALMLKPTEGPFTRPDKLAEKFGFKDCAKAL